MSTTPDLSKRTLLRYTDHERELVEFLATYLGCSLNDAIRVCIWRGAEHVASPTDVDANVLSPEVMERQRERWERFMTRMQNQPAPPLPGQTEISLTNDTETGE